MPVTLARVLFCATGGSRGKNAAAQLVGFLSLRVVSNQPLQPAECRMRNSMDPGFSTNNLQRGTFTGKEM